MATALLLVLLAASPAGRILPSAHPETQVSCVQAEPFTPFAFYVLVEPGTTLADWSASLELPPEVTAMTWSVLPPTALDGDPTDLGFRVDLATPLLPGDGLVAVARVWAGRFTFQAASGPIQVAADPGPGWVAPDGAAGEFGSRTDGSGWPSAVLRLQCGVGAETRSWGAEKARFPATPRTRR